MIFPYWRITTSGRTNPDIQHAPYCCIRDSIKRLMYKEKHPMTQNPSETLLTVREIADRLRVDDTTVRRWIKNGILEAITLPHQGKRRAYRIQQSTLDTLLASSAPIRENS
jgi:excisionase family DNA binding protein